ncbi:MAG TPA: ABC transporter, partial [Bacillota bacterium]|nr:ABC transporter [Bacillota bacterium]
GGEIQRLFLASFIITEMDSLTFIFDEPTIGLHEVEKEKLIAIIKNLVQRGNTVIAVEHDPNFMRAADYIIDLGPGAGPYGGERIFQGSLADFGSCKDSKTAPYLSGEKLLAVKQEFKPAAGCKLLGIHNAQLHNLRNVSVSIPLGLMVGIAGVSGSGKSSLINDTLMPKLKEMLQGKFIHEVDVHEVGAIDEADGLQAVESLHIVEENAEVETAFDNTPGVGALPRVSAHVTGAEYIKKCIVVDQRPIGRSRTSCPATYTGIFDRIRALFAKTPAATSHGYTPGLFTVNSEGGCRVCKGEGVTYFYVGYGNFVNLECEACGGTGFVEEAMNITLDGKNIKEILAMTVSEAVEFFGRKDTQAFDKTIFNILKTLDRVGMGYITLGQKTPTISGGEAQRIKLAKELSKQNGKDNLYILDEPTTGLSFDDTKRLIELLAQLVNAENTVIIIEHDPSVLSNCDYIIEMGPGGGSDGGNIIATGAPNELKTNERSIIGKYLK